MYETDEFKRSRISTCSLLEMSSRALCSNSAINLTGKRNDGAQSLMEGANLCGMLSAHDVQVETLPAVIERETIPTTENIEAEDNPGLSTSICQRTMVL